MMRGLEGRRIGLVTVSDGPGLQTRVEAVRQELEQAGAQIAVLDPGQGSDEDWHGGRYAGLVVIGGDSGVVSTDPRLMQLGREFLASDKPVAAYGNALEMIIRAGGAAGRTVAASKATKAALEAAGGRSVDEPFHADGGLITANGAADSAVFAAQMVQHFADLLEEHDVDDMSEQSFPASDPPATTPGSVGPAAGHDSNRGYFTQ